MNYAVIDCRTPQDCISSLSSYGIEPIFLPPFAALSQPVSAHADMLLFFGDRLFCHADYYAVASGTLDRIASLSGLEVCLSNETVGSLYPDDILFNAAQVGRFLFCRADKISRLVAGYGDRTGLTTVNVRQGYTKCSVLPVSDDAIITADRSIAAVALKHGIDVLEITPGHIGLDGCEYGFIGGASGVLRNRVFFCGDYTVHPDASQIEAFCQRYGKQTVALSKNPLYDVGTMFFI